MGTTATVMIDGTDVTALAVEGSVTKRLNNVSQSSARFHMKGIFDLLGTSVVPGMYVKVYFDTGAGDVLYHHGRIMNSETTADEDGGYVVVNSADPLELWKWRPVRDPGPDFTSSCGTSAPVGHEAGDFSKPQLISDFVRGPQIVEAMCFASENISLGSDDAEGPLFLDLSSGTFECGGADLRGAPKDWPMTMMELASILTSTGELDVVCQPIEFDFAGNYGELSAYNGGFGTDRTASVIFSYGMNAYNVRALRWNTDMSDLCNKLWYFLGPKCDDQHWPANVQAQADFSDCDCCNDPACDPCNDIRDSIVALQGTDAGLPGDSRGDFGVRMDIKIFDAQGDTTGPCAEGNVDGYCLFKNQWLREAFIRLKPRQIVHVTPTRDTAIGTFDIGDLITVEATTDVNGGFSGAQRVYSYTVSWDAEESVPAIGELQVSSDQENFGA